MSSNFIIIKNLFTRLKRILLPTMHDKEVKRYFNDGGDEMFRYLFDIDNNSLVIDLGGYKGQWASDIYSRYKCRIMIFEPVKKYADKMSARFKKNDQIEVFNIALGNSKRTEIISMRDDASSTFLDYGVKEEIQFVDIFEFFNINNIDQVNLMKINIEGGEYEVIPRLIETGLIQKIEHIQVQFHNIGNESEMQMSKIHLALSQTHKCTKRYKFVWENWIRLID